jgi:SAM-dependent methyltransferase
MSDIGKTDAGGLRSSKLANLLHRWGGLFIDPRRLLALSGIVRYISDWVAFRRQSGEMLTPWSDTFPQLDDWLRTTPFDPHYFYQGNWLARRLALKAPSQHVDIGSSVLAIGVLSAFMPTIFVDYRPLQVRQSGLMPVGGDITHLPFADASLTSLSCLHVIEHIGLGRYGDPIDARGARRAALELQRVVAPGGTLYVSTPVGRERVCFNAHRVFSVTTILAMLPDLHLVEFSYVDDVGVLHRNVSPYDVPALDYGCGFFEFSK